MSLRPLTLDETIEAFGDPRPLIREDGTVTPAWEFNILGWCNLPAPLPLSWNKSQMVSKFRCHRLVVTPLEAALKAIFEMPEAWETVGDFGGCYAWRMQRGSRTHLSKHCWGLAIDLDVSDNPQGAQPDIHPAVIAAFEAQGFYWGGNFKGARVDGMHFERGMVT